MVLTQRVQSREDVRGRDQFPYHYGSYATDVIDDDEREELEFPYHYGSYATQIPGRVLL